MGPCDGLASHPGGVAIFLVALCWVRCDGLASHPGGVVILLVASCWVPCDGLASHPEGSSNIPSCFMLRKLELSVGLMGHLAHKQTLPLPTDQSTQYEYEIKYMFACFRAVYIEGG